MIWFIIGVVVGGIFGVITMAVVSAGNNDQHELWNMEIKYDVLEIENGKLRVEAVRLSKEVARLHQV